MGRTGGSTTVACKEFFPQVRRVRTGGMSKKTRREEMTMDINEKLDAVRSGHLSRRDFNKALAAVGVSVAAMPVPRPAPLTSEYLIRVAWTFR